MDTRNNIFQTTSTLRGKPNTDATYPVEAIEVSWLRFSGWIPGDPKSPRLSSGFRRKECDTFNRLSLIHEMIHEIVN